MLAIGSGTFAQFSQNINPNLNIGSVQYCTDLQPASLEIKTVLGTWFGYQLYTHYDTVSGNRYFNPCVYITIHEINHEVRKLILTKIESKRYFFYVDGKCVATKQC